MWSSPEAESDRLCKFGHDHDLGRDHGERPVTLYSFGNYVEAIAFNRDGTRLASAHFDGTVKILRDTATGQETATLALGQHAATVTHVGFSLDWTRIASAHTNHVIKLWDAITGQEIATLNGHTDNVNYVAFSPDGSRLASASSDGTIKLWDATAGQETATLKGHADEVTCVTFMQDGTRIASASNDHTIKVWDPMTGQQTATFNGHKDRVNYVAFSSDGMQIASASADGSVKIRDARPATLELRVEQRAVGLYPAAQQEESAARANHRCDQCRCDDFFRSPKTRSWN